MHFEHDNFLFFKSATVRVLPFPNLFVTTFNKSQRNS